MQIQRNRKMFATMIKNDAISICPCLQPTSNWLYLEEILPQVAQDCSVKLVFHIITFLFPLG